MKIAVVIIHLSDNAAYFVQYGILNPFSAVVWRLLINCQTVNTLWLTFIWGLVHNFTERQVKKIKSDI